MAKRLALRFGRLIVALALLPSLALAGLPRIGCLCADGRFVLNCPAVQHTEGEGADCREACCGNACCGTAPNEGTACCAARLLTEGTDRDYVELAAAGCGNCCTLAIQPASALAIAKKQETRESDATPATPDMPTFAPAHRGAQRSVAAISTGPPIQDLVIKFRRLTI